MIHDVSKASIKIMEINLWVFVIKELKGFHQHELLCVDLNGICRYFMLVSFNTKGFGKRNIWYALSTGNISSSIRWLYFDLILGKFFNLLFQINESHLTNFNLSSTMPWSLQWSLRTSSRFLLRCWWNF